MEDNKNLISNLSKTTIFLILIPKIIISFIILLIGLFIFVTSVFSYINSKDFIETTAVVVDVRYDLEKELYYPIYEYDYNGKMVQADGFPSVSRNDIVIGNKSVISYNPNNYKQFDIGSGNESLITFLIGTFMLFVSGKFLILNFKFIKEYIKGLHNDSLDVN